MLPGAGKTAAFKGREDVCPNGLIAQLDDIALFAKVGGRECQALKPELIERSDNAPAVVDTGLD